MKILIVADATLPSYSGVARFVRDFAIALGQGGHSVLVCSPSIEPEYLPGVQALRLPAVRLPFPHSRAVASPLGLRRRARGILLKFRPDIVHAHSPFHLGREFLEVARDLGVQRVLTNHYLPANFSGFVGSRISESVLANGAFGLQLRQASRLAAVCVAQSPLAKEVLRGAGVAAPTLITCGVTTVQTRVQMVRDEGSFVFVGRLNPEKRVSVLIEAVRRLRDRDLSLTIVGDGPDRERLQAGAGSDLGSRIRFVGALPDDLKMRAVERSRFLCAPSTAELQGLSVLEALSVGTPVVASATGTLVSLVLPGLSGLLALPDSLEDLTRVLARALDMSESEWMELSRGARRVAEVHSTEASVAGHVTLYRELLTLRT